MTTLGTQSFRIHVTNVLGLGATELAKSLLPALDSLADLKINSIYVPDKGAVKLLAERLFGHTVVYRRYLPNALSRILECTLLGSQFDGDSPLLVLGDIPIATSAPQAVFVQNSHLVRRSPADNALDSFRYRISRAIFRRNLRYPGAFIVQSDLMRNDLIAMYPSIAADTVHIVSQPPPSWLLATGVRRKKARPLDRGLRLFYPAAGYPHKNHVFLQGLEADWSELIERLVLTIDPNIISGLPPWVNCTGRLEASNVISEYNEADALLFLSKAESFGFPLVEAMWIGLPILCPDLPYAHALCGEEAIYFDPDNPTSLRDAVGTLRKRLQMGWLPDWRDQLSMLPRDWSAVAAEFAKIVGGLPSEVVPENWTGC
jgi:hypothetical protein